MAGSVEQSGARDPSFDVERWNDQLAKDHDIDDYYGRSSPLIRFIEQRRLDIIRDLMSARPNERLLEVGCGGGHVLRLFPECDLTGVDVSGEMLAKAERNLRGYRVRLVKGELASAGLEERSFDGVVCTEVLEHTVEPRPILADIARLLKPSGRAVITLPNDHLVNALKDGVRRARLTWLPPFRRISWGGDHYHFHVWRIREMRDLISEHFRIEAEGFAPSRLFPIRCCFLGRPR